MNLLLQLVLLLTGLLMVAAPWTCTRRELRGNEDAEKRTRSIGGWLVAAAIIWLIVARLA